MKAQGFARIKFHPAPSDTDIDPRYWVFLDIELERPQGMGSNASQHDHADHSREGEGDCCPCCSAYARMTCWRMV